MTLIFYKSTDYSVVIGNGIIGLFFELISYGRLMVKGPPWAHLRWSHAQYKSSSSMSQLAESAQIIIEDNNWHKLSSREGFIPISIEFGCKIILFEPFQEIIPRDKAGRAALRQLGSCTGLCRCSLISGSPRLWLLEEFLGLSILEPLEVLEFQGFKNVLFWPLGIFLISHCRWIRVWTRLYGSCCPNPHEHHYSL